MKCGRTILISLFATLVAGIAPAQQNFQGAIKHVVVVIQENRTPDNLFHEDSLLVSHGADVISTNEQLSTECGNVTMASASLAACFDPDHSHDLIKKTDNSYYSHGAWVSTYDHGKMDGACEVYIGGDCTTSPACQSTKSCPYTYVDNTPVIAGFPGVLQPYFDMAKYYGFANYTFQTNQGPSFEAHQFLFSGTSAPTNSGDSTDCFDAKNQTQYPCYEWFASELDPSAMDNYGCPNSGADVAAASPAGDDIIAVFNGGWPCYDHNSLAYLLEQNGLTWGYYPQGTAPATSLWTAPNAIKGICYDPYTTSGSCNGADWNNYVVPHFPPNPAVAGGMAPILTDISTCKLPNVSWVIPDGAWSDHAGTSDNNVPAGNFGPSWVSAIVNGVGQNPACQGTNEVYWNDTVVIVVWDDWGGWYDHVLPWNCQSFSQGGKCSGYSNSTGQQYVYGFRVPMLVISAYNKHATNSGDGYVGYISGTPGQGGETQPYVHDFGSILNFVEYAFGTNGHFLSLPSASTWGISPTYFYADYLAPDGPIACSPSQCPYSLSDFFTGAWSTQSQFVPIASYSYGPETFENWTYNDGNVATDPDNDALPPQ